MNPLGDVLKSTHKEHLECVQSSLLKYVILPVQNGYLDRNELDMGSCTGMIIKMCSCPDLAMGNLYLPVFTTHTHTHTAYTRL